MMNIYKWINITDGIVPAISDAAGWRKGLLLHVDVAVAALLVVNVMNKELYLFT